MDAKMRLGPAKGRRECMTRVQSDLGDEGLIHLRRKGKVYLHENHMWVKED